MGTIKKNQAENNHPHFFPFFFSPDEISLFRKENLLEDNFE